MTSDYILNSVVLLIGVANLLFNLHHSNLNSPFWWCDPRGLMAIPLFLSTAGFSIFFIAFGEYPALFGLHEENIQISLLFLAASCWAFTAGTFIFPKNSFIKQIIPELRLGPNSIKKFSRLLIAAIIIVSLVSYYGLYTLDFIGLLSLQYGAGQWDTISTNPWLRASVLGTPLMSALFVLWGIRKKSFLNPWLLIICLFSLLPAVVLGGRKDAIFIMIAIAFAGAIKEGANRIKPLVYAVLIIGTFNYVQAISRDTNSLGADGRLSSLSEISKNENTFIGQVSIALPILPTVTAAMTIFPTQQSFYLGLSYLQTIAGTALPKTLWGDAAFESPNQNFHNLYYPKVTDFSMDYSLAAEGYQNFGLAGIPIAYLLLGAILATFKRISILFKNSAWTLIHIIVFQAGMWCLRSDSNTFFKMSFYTAVVIVTIYFLSILRLRHTNVESLKTTATGNPIEAP